MINQSISVVVPAYNCQKTIGQTIQGIFDQTVRPHEIIVVDDGSTDGTKEVIQSFQDVKYIFQNNAGPAAARNEGARQAQSDLIFFVDSDCIPEPDWIARALPHLKEENVAVVAGSYGIANPESLLARCVHHEILYRHRTLIPPHPKVFGSYNFCARKKVFEEVGGFDVSYKQASGEDNDLSYKILEKGYRIYFEKKSFVRHYHPTRLMKYLIEQYRHGFWRVKMYKTHPVMARGDDYTFWKDIVEIPIAFLILLGIVFSIVVGFGAAAFSFGLMVLLFFLELLFGFMITKNKIEAFFLSWVMLWRVFARTFGFSSGILTFFFSRK